MAIYRNVIRRRNSTGNFWSFYTEGPATPEQISSANGTLVVSRVARPEECPSCGPGVMSYEQVRSRAESRYISGDTYKLDVFYGVLDSIAKKFVVNNNIRGAVCAEIAENIYGTGPLMHFCYALDMQSMICQITRHLVQWLDIPAETQLPGRQSRIREFMALCHGIPRFGFLLPPPLLST